METMEKYDSEKNEYVSYSSQEKIYYYDFCITNYAYYNVINPKYIGCFMDTREVRDLEHLIGEDLTSSRECLNKAKDKGYSFASFQNGNQCWADNSIGKYPRVSEFECRTPCKHDSKLKCGGTMRNAIWDIREY